MEEGDKLVGYDGAAIRFFKYGEFRGDKVVPLYCKNSGYIELYKKKELVDFLKDSGEVRSHE